MPWTLDAAPKHTRKAKTAREKRLWQKVADKVLAETGDEGRAIRAANAMMNRKEKRKGRQKAKLAGGD